MVAMVLTVDNNSTPYIPDLKDGALRRLSVNRCRVFGPQLLQAIYCLQKPVVLGLHGTNVCMDVSDVGMTVFIWRKRASIPDACGF